MPLSLVDRGTARAIKPAIERLILAVPNLTALCDVCLHKLHATIADRASDRKSVVFLPKPLESLPIGKARADVDHV